MSLILKIIFFCQVIFLAILIVNRNPARLPGYEKTRNQNLDKVILIITISLLVVILGFKCR